MFFYHYSLEFETILNPTLGSRSSRLMINRATMTSVRTMPDGCCIETAITGCDYVEVKTRRRKSDNMEDIFHWIREGNSIQVPAAQIIHCNSQKVHETFGAVCIQNRKEGISKWE